MFAAVETERPVLGTERLVLRAPVAGDALMLADFGDDFGVAAMTEALPHPFTVEDAEACLAKSVAGDRVAFVVEHRQLGPIGMLRFKRRGAVAGAPLSEHGPRPELAGWLGRPFWNRGYMTEAVGAALGWARTEGAMPAVWAGHFADNRAAGAMLCKAGFLYTGDVEVRRCVAREAAGVRTRMMVWLA